MAYFPFFIDISGKKILIVGGGNVALRKAEKLVPFEADITVVSPDICYGFAELGEINIIRRRFSDSDIDGAFAVIAATDDRELNRHIFKLCSQRKILVNTVDDPENCGFYFPALVHEGNVTVGIGTDGTAPAFAKYIRRCIEDILDESTLELGRLLAYARPYIKNMFSAEKLRAEACEQLIKFTSDKWIPDEAEIQHLLERIKQQYENKDRNT